MKALAAAGIVISATTFGIFVASAPRPLRRWATRLWARLGSMPTEWAYKGHPVYALVNEAKSEVVPEI